MQLSRLFEDIVSDTIKWETGGDKSGAYTNDPDDAGGPTKWGISQTSNPDVNIKGLTYKDAILIYHEKYWNPFYELTPDPALTFKLFDMGVLNGVYTSVKLLQKSINKAGHKIAVDGRFGPLTATALNLCYAQKQDIYDDYVKRFVHRAYAIVIVKPWNRKYLKGWLSRINFKFAAPIVTVAEGTGQQVRGKK